MNVKALDKLESGWIGLEWEEWLLDRNLTDIEIQTLVDIIDRFKSNRQVKTIVVAKIKSLPAYVLVNKDEYLTVLEWLNEICLSRELYECCTKILKIKNKIVCSQNLKKS